MQFVPRARALEAESGVRLLSVPDRPWRVISMNFIVELPPSDGCTDIFVVVDHLSKMTYFLPLKNMPSAMETAQVFIKEIVRVHGSL